MIDVGSPFDCQWVKGGSAAKASFSCDDMGGSGVSSSLMPSHSWPVVSTPVGAIPEAVDDTVTGILVKPRSASALSTGLARLRDDPELRARYSRAGRARAIEFFGIDRMLDRMESVFRQVLDPA